MCRSCLWSMMCSLCHVLHFVVVCSGTYLSELHNVASVTCDLFATRLAQRAALTCDTPVAPPHYRTHPTGSAGHSRVNRPRPFDVHTHFLSRASLTGQLLFVNKTSSYSLLTCTNSATLKGAYLQGVKVVTTQWARYVSRDLEVAGIHTYALEMDTVATAKLAVGEGGGAQQGLLAYRAHISLQDHSLGLGT